MGRLTDHRGRQRTFAVLISLLLFLGCEGPSTPMPALDPIPTPSLSLPSLPSPRPVPTEASVALAAFLPALRPAFADDLQRMADATRYNLDLHLDMAGLQITGREVVRYTNRERVPLDAIYFRLFPNFPGCKGGMDVTEVRLEGEPLEALYEVTRTALRVPLDPPLDPGDLVTLELYFEVQIPEEEICRNNAFDYSGGVLALAHIYPQIPVYDEEGWNIELAPNYGDLVYADAALYRVTATLPLTMVVATSGTEVSRVRHDDTQTVAWVAGPARDFYIVMSQDYLALTAQVEDIRITSYFMPYHVAGGRQALDYVVQALRFYQQRFGPYRYRELEVAETPTRAGGIEYPGVIVVSAGLYDDDYEGEFLEVFTVHEVAHQWWYNLVGNDQVDAPWVDEALTTYSSIVFFEEVEGEEAGAALLEHYRGLYQELVHSGQDAPVNLPVAGYSEENYDRAVYAKGALFFDALRREVGDGAFWNILQRYYERFLYDIATGEALLEVAKEVSGKDLASLYRIWILNPLE